MDNIEVFELTAAEVAALDEDLIHEYTRRREFRFAVVNSSVRERMLDMVVKEHDITGGWFYWSCLPGCLPDSIPFGPFKTRQEAIQDAEENYGEDDEE